MSDVTEIHVISNKTGNAGQPLNLRDLTSSHFVSGFWTIKKEHLRYGVIFALHKSKREESFLQGTIEDVEMVQGKRVELRIQRTPKPLPWAGLGTGERGYKHGANTTSDDERKRFVPPDISQEELRKIVNMDCVVREGQKNFRNDLLRAYQRKCAVTDCKIELLLEAAHILQYKDHGRISSHVQNGLLLRSDIHTLFDRQLIVFLPLIDGDGVRIEISDRLKGSEYEKLNGQKLRLPTQAADFPSRAALNMRIQHMPKL